MSRFLVWFVPPTRPGCAVTVLFVSGITLLAFVVGATPGSPA